MNLYGALIGPNDVRDAIESTIRTWSPSYLAEVAAQNGRERDALPQFRAFHNSQRSLDKLSESQTPSCVIIVPGTSDVVKDGHGLYRATWPVGIGVICASHNHEEVLELAELYTTVVKALLIQHPDLDGFASGLEWLDDRYDEIESTGKRTMAAGAVNLRVTVDAVLDSRAGLAAPPFDPIPDPGDWSHVETADSNVVAMDDANQDENA